jgi:hypothetical protein
MLIEKDCVLNCVFLLELTNLSLFLFIIISILRKLFKGGRGTYLIERAAVEEVLTALRQWI